MASGGQTTTAGATTIPLTVTTVVNTLKSIYSPFTDSTYLSILPDQHLVGLKQLAKKFN